MSSVERRLKLLQQRPNRNFESLCFGFCRQISSKMLPDAVIPIIIVFALHSDRWDPEHIGSKLTISGINGDIITTKAEGYQSAYGSNNVSSGRHLWTLKILKFVHNSLKGDAWWRLTVGVVDASKESPTELYFSLNRYEFVCVAYITRTDSDLQSQLGLNSDNKYGRVCKEDDIIGIDLDMDRKTLSFLINGENQGVAFKDVDAQKEFKLAVSLTGKGTCLQLVSYEEL